ncbi:MAG: LuxR C-terminal-related transcriptional regulator [Actinomycetota bacterium]|nr:LuxR C-terminal-related transcriptional regulator [Actinomycetota bacterium]
MNDDLLARLLADPTPSDGAAAGSAGGRMLLVHGPRGSGKTWWLDRAASRAAAAGFEVWRTSAVAGEPARRQLLEAAALRTSCLVVDDIDEVEPAWRAALRSAVWGGGSVAIVSGSASSAFVGALEARVRPLPTGDVVAVLQARGVAARAAARCAAAAAGNPGLAIALADGLSDAQRTDTAEVPELPRLAAGVAAELHARLVPLGQDACRALMVAAAADDGDVAAIRAALAQLGETGGARPPSDEGDEHPFTSVFDAAEHAGIVAVAGSRVLFADPWLRLAAYHLVAPSSRRAAHRALAAAYQAPRQAATRVRHLVAATNGPNDQVAHALMAVAASAARRGDVPAAVALAAQAVELSADASVRSACLLRAIGWSLDAGELDSALQLSAGLDGTEPDELVAAVEVRALVRGDEDGAAATTRPGGPASERERASWESRRRRRLVAWAEAEAGQHASVLRQIRSTDAPAEQWARALALRHAGLVRDAAEAAERIMPTLPAAPSEVGSRWHLLSADLAVLTGRFDAASGWPAVGANEAWRAVLARHALAASPTLTRDAASVHVPAGEPLRGVRAAILAGLAGADIAALAAAARAAEQAGLPVEAGEAWLMAGELAVARGASSWAEGQEHLRRAADLLHRCAVRGWDARLQLLAAQQPPQAPVAVPTLDAALAALSAAEWRVAAAVASGQTNREVAATLFLSVKTVDFHLQQIYRKLALRSRTELAVRLAGRVQDQAGRLTAPTQGAAR